MRNDHISNRLTELRKDLYDTKIKSISDLYETQAEFRKSLYDTRAEFREDLFAALAELKEKIHELSMKMIKMQ